MKKAFTLMELVIVILVIGILAAAIIPRTRTNPVVESSIDLLSNIRYVQHLAIIDDKYDASNSTSWYKNRWQIIFNNTTYSIKSNNTYAINPLDKITEIKDIKLKGVTSLTLSGGCSNKDRISFDYLGRPLIGDLSSTTAPYTASGNDGELLQSLCTIQLSNGSKTVYIDINPETGYTRIR